MTTALQTPKNKIVKINIDAENLEAPVIGVESPNTKDEKQY